LGGFGLFFIKKSIYVSAVGFAFVLLLCSPSAFCYACFAFFCVAKNAKQASLASHGGKTKARISAKAFLLRLHAKQAGGFLPPCAARRA
jgi:hypothetical protein